MFRIVNYSGKLDILPNIYWPAKMGSQAKSVMKVREKIIWVKSPMNTFGQQGNWSTKNVRARQAPYDSTSVIATKQVPQFDYGPSNPRNLLVVILGEKY